MSAYVVYYQKNQKAYAEFGERWVKWSQTTVLTPEEAKGISKFFKDIAVRFGLVRRFRNLGII